MPISQTMPVASPLFLGTGFCRRPCLGPLRSVPGIILAVCLTLATLTTTVFAKDAETDSASLDQQLQSLKKDVLELNRDLFILREELLFPANTQVAVFLSLDVGEFFALDAVSVKIDRKEVASHLYTERQLDALVRGGVQRLFLGNLKSGSHEIVAVFTGRGPKGRDFRRASSLTFEKTPSAKFLELKIVDSSKLHQPEFSIREWE